MNRKRVRYILLTMLAGLVVVLYIGLLHHLTAQGRPSVLGGALALVPMGLTTLWLAWISPRRTLAVGLWLAVVALLAINHQVLAHQFKYIELVQHAGTFGCLTAVFGRTLMGERTPMISVFARTVHGDLAPPLADYTRKATLAWAVLFGLMTLASLWLFFSDRIAQWSLLANVLTPIIIGAMFVVEYAIRCRVLPPELRSGLIRSVRAAWPAFDRWAAQGVDDTDHDRRPDAERTPGHAD